MILRFVRTASNLCLRENSFKEFRRKYPNIANSLKEIEKELDFQFWDNDVWQDEQAVNESSTRPEFSQGFFTRPEKLQVFWKKFN